MSGNIISMMWQNIKKIHRRKVKILRSPGQNEENMCLNPKIDNQNISVISTVPMLINLYGENFKGN